MEDVRKRAQLEQPVENTVPSAGNELSYGEDDGPSEGSAQARPAPTSSRGLSESAVELGNRIRQARLARKLTQSELAAGMFSMSYISALERGQIRPSLGALERLATRLQVPVDELLRTSGRRSRYASITGSVAGGSAAWLGVDEVESRLSQARMSTLAGAPQEGLAILDSLARRRLSWQQRTQLQQLMAATLIALGRYDDARRAAEEGLGHAEQLGAPAWQARLLLELGRAQHQLAQRHEALRSLTHALDLLEHAEPGRGGHGRRGPAEGPTEDPALLRDVLLALGEEESLLGQVERSRIHLSACVELAAQILDPSWRGAAYRQLSGEARDQGDRASTQEYMMRSIAAFEAAQSRRREVEVAHQMALAFLRGGYLEQVFEQLDRGIALAERHGDKGAQAQLLTVLAQALLRRQQVDEAQSAAQRAMQMADETHDTRAKREAVLTSAQALQAKGDLVAAGRLMEQGIELLRSESATEELIDAYARYSEILEQTGEAARAFEILKLAWELQSGRNTNA